MIAGAIGGVNPVCSTLAVIGPIPGISASLRLSDQFLYVIAESARSVRQLADPVLSGDRPTVVAVAETPLVNRFSHLRG